MAGRHLRQQEAIQRAAQQHIATQSAGAAGHPPAQVPIAGQEVASVAMPASEPGRSKPEALPLLPALADSTSPERLPVYESTFLWGAFSMAVGLVLVYVAATFQDLRGVLVLSWALFTLSVFAGVKGRIKRGWLKAAIVTAGGVALGFALFEFQKRFPQMPTPRPYTLSEIVEAVWKSKPKDITSLASGYKSNRINWLPEPPGWFS